MLVKLWTRKMSENFDEERRVGMVKLLTTENRTQLFIGVTSTLITIVGILIWYTFLQIKLQIGDFHDDLKYQNELVTTLQKEMIKLTIYPQIHEREARLHIKLIHENKMAIRELQTDISARPDAFTGRQGNMLRARINKLEQQCAVVQEQITRLFLHEFKDEK